MSLSKYFKIAWRWWWLVFISVALAATGSYSYTKQQPNVYAAKATVRVGASVTENLNVDQGTLRLSQTLAEVYAELVKRNKITQGVIDRLKEEGVELNINSGQLSGMINTAIIESAQLLEIYVMDVDPDRAIFLADAIAEELVRQSPANSQVRQQSEAFIREQLADVQAKIKEINQEIEDAAQNADEADSAIVRQEARNLMKELEIRKSELQSNYTNLLSNLSDSSANQLQIFERARGLGLVGPNAKMNIVMASAIGFALAVAAVIVIEFFDDTLTWQGEGMTSINGLSVLGAVGKLAGDAEKIIAHDKLWSPESNALRELRDSIFLATEDKPLSTLLITSPLAGEGKTFIAANLGVTVASSSSTVASVSGATSTNKNIILIDADLRKPALHEIFDIPNLIGLSDVLVTPESAIETTLKQALRPTYLDNLFILPAGRTLADPGSLLNSVQFVEIIRYLSTRSHLIIVDSAPILEAVETRAIDNIVDGTLLVVSHGRTRTKVVDLVMDYFKSKKKDTFLGLIFNRVKLPYSQDYAGQAMPTQQFEKSFLGGLWSGKRQRSKSTLTLAEAAVHLGVKKETVRRWCEMGRIPGIKTGRRWKIRLEDVEEYITFYKLNNAEVEKVLKKSPVAVHNNGAFQKESSQKPNELPARVELNSTFNNPTIDN